MRTLLLKPLIALPLLAGLLSAPAQAGADMYESMTAQHGRYLGTLLGADITRAAQEPSATSSTASLRFTPSAAVTRQLNQRLTDILAPQLAQGRRPEELRQLLDSRVLHRTFKQAIEPYGFSDQDLGDVLAAYLIISWQVIHGDTGKNPSGVAAVRQHMRDSLARASWVQGVSDAHKQALAETLIVGTMINADRYATARHSGNTQLATSAQQDTDTMVRTVSGLQLQHYRFTAQGLLPR